MALTFELNTSKDEIEIIFDKDGLELLRSSLAALNPDRNGIDHIHLMTKEWGGEELSSEILHNGNILVNHVKIVYIKE